MAFARHFRVTATGSLGNNAEIFSYGFNLQAGPTPVPFDPPNQTAFADIANDVAAFHGHTDTRISSSAILTQVKVAQIGVDGKYESDPWIYEKNVPGFVNPSSNQTLPQSALACSLNTARRGPTGKGRFFIPMPTVIIDPNTFLMDAAVTLLIRGRVEALIEDVNNTPGVDIFGSNNASVVIASTKGYNTPVTSVRIGRVVDTIRSRRSKIPETYTADAGV